MTYKYDDTKDKDTVEKGQYTPDKVETKVVSKVVDGKVVNTEETVVTPAKQIIKVGTKITEDTCKLPNAAENPTGTPGEPETPWNARSTWWGDNKLSGKSKLDQTHPENGKGSETVTPDQASPESNKTPETTTPDQQRPEEPIDRESLPFLEAKVPSQSSTGTTQRYLSEKKTTDKTMTSQDNTGGERKGIHASQKVKAMSSLPKTGSQNSQFLLLAAGLLLSGSIFSLKRNSKFRR